jgi:hypothetical protein
LLAFCRFTAHQETEAQLTSLLCGCMKGSCEYKTSEEEGIKLALIFAGTE